MVCFGIGPDLSAHPHALDEKFANDDGSKLACGSNNKNQWLHHLIQ